MFMIENVSKLKELVLDGGILKLVERTQLFNYNITL